MNLNNFKWVTGGQVKSTAANHSQASAGDLAELHLIGRHTTGERERERSNQSEM